MNIINIILYSFKMLYAWMELTLQWNQKLSSTLQCSFLFHINIKFEFQKLKQNITIYYKEKTQWRELTLLMLKLESSRQIRPTPWLLMARLLVLPGHYPPWTCLRRVGSYPPWRRILTTCAIFESRNWRKCKYMQMGHLRRCVCSVNRFCYQLKAKPGNKTAAPPWPDPNIM